MTLSHFSLSISERTPALTSYHSPRLHHNNVVAAQDNGIQNILALRGDPPKGTDKWEAKDAGFRYASDLIRLIREEHGDYFGICCAGYPEGLPDSTYEDDLRYLKEKVDTGADFVISQLFYDCDRFLDFVKDCRALGIKCPILPGIMPIHTYGGWKRMTDFCKTKIPESIRADMARINLDDDNEVKAYGIRLCVQMCKYLVQNGTRGFHFYTLNLEKSVLDVLQDLDLLRCESIQKPLPWKATANARRQKEGVRPIFWSNRPKSYVCRTSTWDDFPNGRWTNSNSPAYGELSDYHIVGLYSHGTKEKRREMWGEVVEETAQITLPFVRFIKGDLLELPWVERSETGELAKETTVIINDLLQLNSGGFWTINSQPRVNGVPSTDPIHGWGPNNGFVYQKAYLEFFCSPDRFHALRERLNSSKTLTFHAVNAAGESYSNASCSVNAVTWGVFPDCEVLQPTVVDRESFLAWKDEAFALWMYWADSYDEGSNSRKFVTGIHDTYYLVNIVDNNFVDGDIFALFEGLC